MLDPKTMKYSFIDTCFGTHHLQFGYDADDTLWLSGARQMQASVSSVWRWWQTYQRAGPRGLRPRPTPGQPPRLSEGQLRTLERILARGPRRAGS
jgi:hypothetical protein